MTKANYTKIPNEILETLAKTKMTGYERRYLDVVFRKTYGWSKKSDYISNSQFVRATGIKKQHVWRTEKRLLWRRIVTKRGNKIALNTSYEQWRELPKGATVTKSGIEVTQRGKKVTQNGGHKKHLPNETKQKKENSSFKNKVEAYKQGKRWGEKPYFRNSPMRWVKDKKKWYVIENDEWKEFAGNELEIEWKK